MASQKRKRQGIFWKEEREMGVKQVNFRTELYNIFCKMINQSQQGVMEQEEQIMILLEGIDENEEDVDLLEQLVAEPKNSKKSSESYDYEPAPIPNQDIEEPETTELKTSNRSTSTCADSEAPIRRCFCSKTRCLKNYCECFKQGLACTDDCECVACGNKKPLFLGAAPKDIIKCRCLKSHCLKKYCQCHSAGRPCGPACGCLDCQNIKKVGVSPEKRSMELEQHDIDHYLFSYI